MEKEASLQGRELLEGKLMDALKEEIITLSLDSQEVLIDDLVTAFQNRKHIFMKIMCKPGR